MIYNWVYFHNFGNRCICLQRPESFYQFVTFFSFTLLITSTLFPFLYLLTTLLNITTSLFNSLTTITLHKILYKLYTTNNNYNKINTTSKVQKSGTEVILRTFFFFFFFFFLERKFKFSSTQHRPRNKPLLDFYYFSFSP